MNLLMSDLFELLVIEAVKCGTANDILLLPRGIAKELGGMN